MKKFFTTMFACVFGVLIAGFVMFWIMILSFAGIATLSSSAEYQTSPKTILHINLSGILTERTKEDPMNMIFGDNTETLGLDETLKAISIAKDDKNISGIYIEANGLSAGVASINAIRDALNDFKESGKFIYAYGDNYSQREYYLSAAADSVFMNPVGMLDFRGLASEITFYKNLMEKVGIEMQVFKVGTYKSAVEPYIATKMSEANKEQTRIYMDAIWSDLLTNLSKSRSIPVLQLNAYADTLLMTKAPETILKYGFVDKLIYRPAFENLLKEKVGIDKDKELTLASVKEIASISQPKNNAKDKIAVVYAVGEIDGASGDGINTEKLVKDLTKIEADKNIKAVVLRVNSPGGSAFGSEQVWEALEQIKKAGKPVVASMGDVAASGGYYISCGANRIFAEPTTLTGSIGIFGLIPNFGNLLTDKIGLTFDGVKTNKYGTFPNVTSAMTPDERLQMQQYVERGYELFTSRCAEGRHMDIAAIKKIAEGRVWDGTTAKKIGLVDELGSMKDAIEWIAQEANMEKYALEEYPKKKGIFEELMEQFGNKTKTAVLKSYLGSDYIYFETLKNMREIDPLQCRMEDIVIY